MHEPIRSTGVPDTGGVRRVPVAAYAHTLHASSLTSELLVHTLRPNVLIIGPVVRIEATVAAIVDALSTPVRYWTPDSPLPSPADGTTTVIPDVATLSLPLQEAWLARLNAEDAHHTQIIATSSIAVFPLVARGVFLEDLYYQLNTVLLDVRKSSTAD